LVAFETATMKFLRTLTVIGTAAVFAAACGGHGTASPASPTSASSAAPVPSASGATISGTVLGAATTSSFAARGAGITVTVNNSSMASTVDASGHFTLNGVPTGHVELHFSGPGVDARVAFDDVADHETIQITLHVSGGTVDVDESHRNKSDNRSELEGRVASLNAAARTLSVGDVTVSVPTTATIRHGDTTLTFAQIKIGDRIEVKGVRSGNTLNATEVKVETDHPEDPNKPGDDGDDDADEAEVEGSVTIQTRACPAVTFTVGTATTVVTNASTEFRDTTCATLATGDTVEVKGAKQTSGAVLAKRVEKKK
jgi:Domain of unknown function (DUF5666)